MVSSRRAYGGTQTRERRKHYYWIVSQDPETGRDFLLTGAATEEEARGKGLEMLSGLDFRLLSLPTSNLDAARAMFNGDRLDKYHSPTRALSRQGHEKSVARMLRRKRSTNRRRPERGY